MTSITGLLTHIVSDAFAAEGLPPELGQVSVSGRPDLAQFQCNGALAAAKAARRPPRQIAEAVVAALLDAFPPHNAIWASDWPFIQLTERPAYADILSLVGRWLPDQADLRCVLWETPARLYGFAEMGTGAGS